MKMIGKGALAAAVLMSVCLSGCGGEKADERVISPKTVCYKDIEYTINERCEDQSDFVHEIGEDGKSSLTICNEGKDKPALVLLSDDSARRVRCIMISDKKADFHKGIGIGATKDEIRQAYEYETENSFSIMVCFEGENELDLSFEENKFIEYSTITYQFDENDKVKKITVADKTWNGSMK